MQYIPGDNGCYLVLNACITHANFREDPDFIPNRLINIVERIFLVTLFKCVLDGGVLSLKQVKRLDGHNFITDVFTPCIVLSKGVNKILTIGYQEESESVREFKPCEEGKIGSVHALPPECGFEDKELFKSKKMLYEIVPVTGDNAFLLFFYNPKKASFSLKSRTGLSVALVHCDPEGDIEGFAELDLSWEDFSDGYFNATKIFFAHKEGAAIYFGALKDAKYYDIFKICPHVSKQGRWYGQFPPRP